MSQPGRAVSSPCWDTGHSTGWSLGLGEQEAPVTSPAHKASPPSDAICSWPGGEALWQWGDFVPAAFVPCQELCCPARRVQLRLRAAGLWLIQQHWELLGRTAACLGCAQPPAPALPPCAGPWERFKGAQKAFGPWARCRGMPLQCHCDPGGSPSRHTPWTFFQLFRASVSIALRRAWGIFPSVFPSYRQGRRTISADPHGTLEPPVPSAH